MEVLQTLEVPDRQNVELIVWTEYAAIAEYFDDLKTAVDYNEKLLLRQPDDPTFYLALERLYGALGDPEKAAESLRKCGELAERLNDRRILAILATKGHLPKEENARAQRLAGAVATYHEILEELALEAMPDRWAAAQTVLGRFCRQHAELLTGPARTRKLEEAAAAYREALRVRTPEAFPDENRAVRQALGEVERLLSAKS